MPWQSGSRHVASRDRQPDRQSRHRPRMACSDRSIGDDPAAAVPTMATTPITDASARPTTCTDERTPRLSLDRRGPETYEETISRLPPLMRRTFTPAGDRVEGRVRRAVSARRPHRPAVAHLPRPGPGRLDRRRRHQAQARLRHRPAHDRGHRPGRHVGQRLPVRRRRAALVPRLCRHEPRRPGTDQPRSSRGSATAASRPSAHSWAARRRSCPTSIRRGNTTWPGSASGSSSASTCSTAATSARATRSSAWPARDCTPTATAWRARSSSTTPV